MKKKLTKNHDGYNNYKILKQVFVMMPYSVSTSSCVEDTFDQGDRSIILIDKEVGGAISISYHLVTEHIVGGLEIKIETYGIPVH